MKKAIVLLALGFTLTYCNPSQQADQTTTDSSRTTTNTMSGTTSSGSTMDTTSHPDSLPH